MRSKDAKIFLEALEELEKEKGISKESLLETVEQALLAAYKKHYGDEEKVEVEIDRETGEIGVYEVKTVVDDVYDAALEISVEDAREVSKRAKIGDQVKIEVNCEEFRRNAIQNGKQIVIYFLHNLNYIITMNYSFFFFHIIQESISILSP